MVLGEEESHQRGTASPGEELGILAETTSNSYSLAEGAAKWPQAAASDPTEEFGVSYKPQV